MIGFFDDKLDRVPQNRNEGQIEEAWTNPNSRIIFFVNGDSLFQKKERVTCLFRKDELLNLTGLSDISAEYLYLGLFRGFPIFACSMDVLNLADYLSEHFFLLNVRTALVDSLIPSDEMTLLGYARSKILWRKQNLFCSHCGHLLSMQEGGNRLDCSYCGNQFFPRIDPVAIMLVYYEDDCLLGANLNFPEGRYSCLAGFIETGETLEHAVRREVWEEAGIRIGYVQYRLSQPWPFSNQLMLGCFAEAEGKVINFDREEMKDVRWFSKYEAAALLEGKLENLSGPPSQAVAHVLIQDFIKK